MYSHNVVNLFRRSSELSHRIMIIEIMIVVVIVMVWNAVTNKPLYTAILYCHVINVNSKVVIGDTENILMLMKHLIALEI